MSEIKDGGPAFPVPEPGLECGMTLLDYFAIHADMRELIEPDGFIPQRLALAVMGGENPPNWDSEQVAATQWWCEAEAKIRYIKAHAMLRARGAA
jgi:hypothetical protein